MSIVEVLRYVGIFLLVMTEVYTLQRSYGTFSSTFFTLYLRTVIKKSSEIAVFCLEAY